MPVSESSNICHMIINTTFLISQNYIFSMLYYSYFPRNADMQRAVKGRIWAFASSSLHLKAAENSSCWWGGWSPAGPWVVEAGQDNTRGCFWNSRVHHGALTQEPGTKTACKQTVYLIFNEPSCKTVASNRIMLHLRPTVWNHSHACLSK